MDGSNSYICRDGVYARSHATVTDNPWDKNLFERGGTYDQVKGWLAENEGIYGENMYGVHSIEYNKLPSYFSCLLLVMIKDGIHGKKLKNYHPY